MSNKQFIEKFEEIDLERLIDKIKDHINAYNNIGRTAVIDSMSHNSTSTVNSHGIPIRTTYTAIVVFHIEESPTYKDMQRFVGRNSMTPAQEIMS